MRAWNNGKEVPKWGFAEIQKMSPSTTGRCKYTREWGQPTNAMGAGHGDMAANHTDLLSGCGRTCVFADQAWLNL